MQRRALNAVALALGVAAAPSLAAAQSRNLPGADTPRLLVVVFQSRDRAVGVQVADAVRQRLTTSSNPRQLYVVPREQMVSFLESSGYKADSSLGTTDLKELAKGLRADEIIGGEVVKDGSGTFHIEPRLMLAVDPSVGQPLPAIDASGLTDATRQLERSIGDARKQLPDNKACENHIRNSALDKAVVSANLGIQKYPNAVIARLCLANAYKEGKKPDSVLRVTEHIRRLDPKSKLANQFAFLAYKEKADAEPDTLMSQQYRESSVRMLVALLAIDPTNQALQNQVITELAKLGKPAVAIPIVDELLKHNPGDPPLLKQRWLLMLADASGADSASKAEKFGRAVVSGEDMVKADSSLADSAYYHRQVISAMATSAQRGAEWAARAAQRYPTNQDYWWYKASSERKAGQLQAAQQTVSRLLSLNPKYPLANVMLGQLFLEQQMTDSAVALARRAVASGEDSKTWGNFLQRPTQDAVKEAQASDSEAKKDTLSKEKAARALTDWEAALALSQETDKLAPAALSKYFVGITSFSVGYATLQAAQKPKSCPMAKKAQDMFLLTQLNLPAGGSIDPATAQQLLGFVSQLAPAADQMVKAYCK